MKGTPGYDECRNFGAHGPQIFLYDRYGIRILPVCRPASHSNVIKNMNNIRFFGDTLLQDLEKYIIEFLKFCKEKKMKLKMSKLKTSEQVEFPGATLTELS